MKKREGKVGRSTLIIFTILSILLLFIVFETQHSVRSKYYEEKIKAGQIFGEAINKIKQERSRLAIPIDPVNDPNLTGIVGGQYTPITIERSDLSASLTSTNPNFPAVLVELLKRLNLKKGDTIAIGLDGSYPAVNLALFSALRVMDIKPVIISSASSAMWGANNPNLTWLDIENLLYKDNYFQFKSGKATLGGEDDLGRGFSPEARQMLVDAIERNETQLIVSENLENNIKKRVDWYQSQGRIKVFVNIGKSVAIIGDNGSYYSTGILRKLPRKAETNSVIRQMLEKKIPVININDVNRLASRYGLPNAPVPLPELGKGKLFTEKRLSWIFALASTIVVIICLFLVIEYDLEYYLKREKEL
jgi:poly-gamma-glutamate system protein